MHHKRENNTLGQDIRKLKQTKGHCSGTMIILLHSIPFQGIMLSASQINADIANSYILLFQCNPTILLSNDIYKTKWNSSIKRKNQNYMQFENSKV